VFRELCRAPIPVRARRRVPARASPKHLLLARERQPMCARSCRRRRTGARVSTPTVPHDRVVARAQAGSGPSPRSKRSSARTTAARRIEPREVAGRSRCLTPGAVATAGLLHSSGRNQRGRCRGGQSFTRASVSGQGRRSTCPAPLRACPRTTSTELGPCSMTIIRAKSDHLHACSCAAVHVLGLRVIAYPDTGRELFVSLEARAPG
jgi:hypothetical protein